MLVLVAGAAGLALWLYGRPAGSTGPDQQRLMRDTLIADKVDLARADLDKRDYATAASHAREALSVDPANADAREVLGRAETARRGLDAAVEDARAAYARGDAPGARTAIARVLALDPRNAVAGELSAQLDRASQDHASQARPEPVLRAAVAPATPANLPAARTTRVALPASSGPASSPTRRPLRPTPPENRAPAPVEAAPPAEPPAAPPPAPPATPASSSTVLPPILISQMAPHYPASAGNVAGSVQLTALVDSKGEVSDVRVLSSAPPNVGFEAAAVEHARSRRYRPATQGGAPIAIRVAILVNFVPARPPAR